MGRASARIAEGRESASLRRVTTSVVAVIAAGALAASLASAPAAPAQEDASQDTSPNTVESDITTESESPSSEARGQEPSELALLDELARTTDATLAASAAGSATTSGHVLVAGDPDFGSTAAYAQLTQAIAAFEAKGWSLGISVVDLGTGRTLRYQADQDFYCASTIKAPFTVAGYELLVDTGEVAASEVDDLAEVEIIQSDNDAYLSLRNVFGSDAFATWLETAAVSPGVYTSLDELAQTHYPHLTCRQLSGMWQHIYAYLSSGQGSAQKLIRLVRGRKVSPIREALGTTYETWSKAGWIDFSSSGGVEPATWDAGVVFATSGTYVLVVGSTAPAQLTSLGDVITAADAAHDAIMAYDEAVEAGSDAQ